MRRFWILAAGLLFLPLAGCSHEQSPDEAMQVVATGLADNKPQVYWESLPPSYQKDVDGLVKEFAGKMDPEIWNGGFGVAKKVVRILKEKKEYVLENPFLAMSGVKKEDLNEHWDDAVQALSILVNSDISQIDQLKTLNIEEFLATTGSDFMEHATVLLEAVPQADVKNSIATLKSAKFELVKMDGDVATVKMTTPNKAGEIEEAELVKVEGKWILKEVADNWAQTMKDAREGLANLNTDDMKENKEVIMAQIKMVDAQLNLLLDSKSADEFNGKLTAMAMMMGAGGGGGPPTGFGGGEDFGPPAVEGDEAPAVEGELPGFKLPADDVPTDSSPESDPLFDESPKSLSPGEAVESAAPAAAE